MFFKSWENIERIIIVGIVCYIALVVILRISGNRTLSQFNSFDFIITVAMGSTFSAGLLQKSIPISETIVALGWLILMQFIMTKLSVRFKPFSKAIKGNPSLLYFDDEFLEENMRKSRVVKEEILASIRQQGIPAIEQVGAVVLETNGKMTVMKKVPEQLQFNVLEI